MFWSRIIYLVALLVWNLCFLGIHSQRFFSGYSQACKHFTCQPLKGALQWWFPPPLKAGMSPPFLTSTNQAGAGFASLVPWQAAGEADASIGRVLSSPSLSPGFGCGTLVRPWHFSTLG